MPYASYEKHKEWVYNWRRNNKRRWAQIHRKCILMIKYGITDITYAKRLISQNNKCYLCKKDFKQATPCVSMSKDRKKLLGLACRSCICLKANKTKKLNIKNKKGSV